MKRKTKNPPRAAVYKQEKAEDLVNSLRNITLTQLCVNLKGSK